MLLRFGAAWRSKVRVAALALLFASALAALVAGIHASKAVGAHDSAAAQLSLSKYPQQKVVYHVMDGATLLHPHFARMVLAVARNHVNAVEKGQLDLRIVLQGNGVELLKSAKTDNEVATSIDKLKADGVRFLICRNTLVAHGWEVEDLYGAEIADIVLAGVAEVAALQSRGYVYLKL